MKAIKILYLDPYTNTEVSKRYLYYEGLFNSLKKLCDIYLYRELFLNFNDIKDKIPFTPDVAIFGLSWLDKHKYYGIIKNLDFPKVCFIFKPQNNLANKFEFCKNNSIELILSPNKDYKFYGENIGAHSKLFPYGFDPNIFKPRIQIPKKFDFGFSGALHNQKHYVDGSFRTKNMRRKIHNKVLKISRLKLFWKSSDVFKTARIHNNYEYAKTINSSFKICFLFLSIVDLTL